MKLIIQIPCFNEEQTLPEVLEGLPRTVPGFDEVEVLVIDDGSTDRTAEVAREHGVDHLVIHRSNQGLARAFRTGLETALVAGADVIVNTDGDHQYPGAEIPRLTEPILRGLADIVVGDRQTATLRHFSPLKRLLQAVGSYVVRVLSGTSVPDSVSGFRAISREAALKLNIVSSFSYTIETVIQAGKRDIAVTSVPVRTNPKTRESRLFKGMTSFITRQVSTIIRMYAMYQPLKVFFYLGTLLSVLGLIPIVRFLFFYFTGSGGGHIQSLVLGGVLLLMGFIAYLAGLVADLISFNRQLLEMTLERVKRQELAHTLDRPIPAQPPEVDHGGSAMRRQPFAANQHGKLL